MYIFGGKSTLGILNDLWTFSVDSLVWNEITYANDAPSPRAWSAFTSARD